MLVSIGRVFNSDNLGLEEVGVKTSKGMILVDNRMRTSVEGIYAIGDVASHLRLAYYELSGQAKNYGLWNCAYLYFYYAGDCLCRPDGSAGQRRRI